MKSIPSHRIWVHQIISKIPLQIMIFLSIILIFAILVNANKEFSNSPNIFSVSRIVSDGITHKQQQTALLAATRGKRFRPELGLEDVLQNIKKKQRAVYNITYQNKHFKIGHLKHQQIPRGGSKKQSKVNETTNTNNEPTRMPKSNVRMYMWCLLITLIWISTGTLFYSKYNNWPIPQSFFYAVDAGMSVGFCTDVSETRIGSRAFTIVFILLGASCVGGALALFVKDVLEGIVDLRRDKFEQLLATHAATRYQNEEGKLTHADFRTLIEEWSNEKLTDESFYKICKRFDRFDRGLIKGKLFVQKCKEMDLLIDTNGPLYSSNFFVRKYAQLKTILKELFDAQIYRIFTVFVLWLSSGIFWGHYRQGWDWITATHFAVSALATGGLTAPDVNEMGILPTEPALFCGVFCLFGIPLFALTLGHFARLLVEGYVVAVEEKALMQSINQPLDPTEFEYAKHLCSVDEFIHLSDFLVLQLLRQGKIDVRTVELIKQQFEALDEDKSGRISYQEAMSQIYIHGLPPTVTDLHRHEEGWRLWGKFHVPPKHF